MRMDNGKPPPADSHDLIRVQGARVNNLKVSVELPKRALKGEATDMEMPRPGSAGRRSARGVRLHRAHRGRGQRRGRDHEREGQQAGDHPQ